ncbi:MULTISPECIES: hypothetical protein [unclassified Streptomyces]|uniref:hypothetical protein n=1 Tax=unclassified Streptomyces TaxID=2593676 RepID=UPI00081E1258|nr:MULTISPECIES: hypothetical protein [unclassified Streptomyces]SCF48104.1 hypothetical protein GA0115257_119732 [Streptomyces sp. LcepLS]
MPTAVAVTGSDLVLPSPDRHTPGAVPLGAATGAPLAESLAELHALLEQHGWLIVLHSTATDPETIRRVRTARAALEADRVTLVGLDLPPLGLALVALQLRQLSVCDFTPGVLASAARLLAHYVHAGAVLGSLARLDRVPVPLGSHARSRLPGTQYAVLAHPEPRLVKAVPGAELPGPDFATRLYLAHGDRPSTWLGETLARTWQVQSVTEVPLPKDSAAWWGTGKLTEFAAGIPDISVLYQLVSSVRRERCRWCGLEFLGDRCGFCGAPLAPPALRAPVGPRELGREPGREAARGLSRETAREPGRETPRDPVRDLPAARRAAAALPHAGPRPESGLPGPPGELGPVAPSGTAPRSAPPPGTAPPDRPDSSHPPYR